MDICDAAEVLEAEERARGVRAAQVALIATAAFDCEDCGDAIPPERKAAFPAARRCIGCQGTAERLTRESSRGGRVYDFREVA